MTEATRDDHSDLAETIPDLRVARVVEARAHPNADRLTVLEIDLGDQTRQVVAGIAGHYHPDELTDKHIVVVSNLKPARLRGEASQGMLLAAENEDVLGLVLAPGAVPGTRLRAPSAPRTPAPDQHRAVRAPRARCLGARGHPRRRVAGGGRPPYGSPGVREGPLDACHPRRGGF